jgi:hypothetical protein
VVAFEDEDGLGEYADALWAGADFGRGALRVAKPRSAGPRMLLTIRLWAF